jgi:tRNA (guanine37-N1)-methyltransferase
MEVPEVLLNGHHEDIRRWRLEKSIEKTRRNRPDLFEGGAANEEVKELLHESEVSDHGSHKGD